MNYFGDEWGGDGGWGAKPKPVVKPEPVAPIGPEKTTTKQAPIKQAPIKQAPISQPAPVSRPTQAPADPASSAPQPAGNSGFNYFDGDDDWGDSDLTGAMSSTFTNIIPDTTQPKQPEPAEVVEEPVVQVKEEPPAEVKKPVEPKRETRPPKTTAQAGSEIIGSSGMGWGKQNIQNLANKAPSKRQNSSGDRRRGRDKKQSSSAPGRKAPISSQAASSAVAPPVAATTTQSPVGSAPKHQVTTEPSSVPKSTNDPLVQSLMEKVHALETKVEELESRQIHQFGGVCTLNSTGKTNRDLHVIWDSTNHIIRPQKGLNLIEPEKVFLEVSHRGLYQITFTTCGTNPQLIINGHVYAAARSALARTKPISSTSCVNIYLYLDEKATIAGRVTDEIASENPCEHWMCVRLVHQGF